MNVKKKLYIGVRTIVGSLLLAVLPLSGVHAGTTTATMTLSAAPSSVVQNSNVVVTVTIGMGATQSDGANASITFDTTKLQYVSIDYTGSPFNSDDPSGGVSGGTINIARYINAPPGPSGNIKLAAITFKALASSGSTSPAIDKANSYVGDHSDGTTPAPGTVTGTTISFTAPTTPVTPTTPTTPTTTTTTTTSTPTTNTTTSTPKTAAPAPTANKTVTTTPSAPTPTPGVPTPTPVVQTIPAKPASKSSFAGAAKIGLSIGGGLAALAALLVGLRYLMSQKRKSMLYSGVPYTTMGTPVSSSTPATTMPKETQKVFDEIPTNNPAPATIVQPNSSGVSNSDTPPAPGSVVEPPK